MRGAAEAATARLPGGGARFRAIVRAVVPESDVLGEAGWQSVESIVAGALARRPAGVRRQLALFTRLLDVVALLRRGRTLARLPDAERFALLDGLAKSNLLLLRRGVWGLRTLAFMGFYARPEAGIDVGYRATAQGWAARSTTTRPRR